MGKTTVGGAALASEGSSIISRSDFIQEVALHAQWNETKWSCHLEKARKNSLLRDSLLIWEHHRAHGMYRI
ncbi:hypothetical protein TNCT_401141 [Trichonephila clavata]|uniref:Uncharacterized protein n=1 Tax=Trichonephila clavata TaxID=2740835 RepID=A0A8X6HU90_TRICU|nr:hypothetical protein TNCT_401141 [Trichonephila clavata]